MSETVPPPYVLPSGGWTEVPQDLIDAVANKPTEDIILNGSEAKALNTQSAQLLLMLKAHAETMGATFRIDDISDPAQKSLQVLGLDHLLLEPQT